MRTPSTLSTLKWWLAPIAAGAAAVTLWMVVPQEQQIATAPPAVPFVVPLPSASTGEPTVPPSAAAAKAAPPVESQPLAAPQEAVTVTPEPQLRREARQQAAEAKQLEDTAASARDRVTREEKAAPAPPAAAAAAPSPARSAFAPLLVASPASPQRWRAVDAGIERSLDGGATWTLVRPSAGETLTAGSSPEANVVWLIGRDGVILLSTDGERFVRVEAPIDEQLASIAAVNATTASITTATGRTLRTVDGGRTWQ